MRNFFLKTNRMGFSQWEENDGELARQLWGDPEVTRWICASGRFRPDEITARLLQAAAAFALIPRAGMNRKCRIWLCSWSLFPEDLDKSKRVLRLLAPLMCL